MRFLSQIKQSILIKLLKVLGFGNVITFCICGCDLIQTSSSNDPHNAKEVNSMTPKATDDFKADDDNTVISNRTAAVADQGSTETSNDLPEVEQNPTADPSNNALPIADTTTDSQNNAMPSQADPAVFTENQDSTNDDVSMTHDPNDINVVTINYDPPNAEAIIFVDGRADYFCPQSPCIYKLDPSKSTSVKISAEGYTSQEVSLYSYKTYNPNSDGFTVKLSSKTPTKKRDKPKTPPKGNKPTIPPNRDKPKTPPKGDKPRPIPVMYLL